MGGISRKYIHVVLPPNTVYWHYVFTTSLDTDNSKMLASVARDAIKIAASAAAAQTGGISLELVKVFDNVKIPIGKSYINAYVLDRENTELFLNKKAFRYMGDAVTKAGEGHYSSAETYGGDFYIAVQNTSSMQRAVYVNIQVFATVTESNPVQVPRTAQWDYTEREKVYTSMLRYCKEKGLGDTEAKQAAACMQVRIVRARTLEQVRAMTTQQWAALVGDCFGQCQPATEINSAPNQYQRAYKLAVKGYDFYVLGRLDSCIAYSRMALAVTDTIPWARADIALCQLVRGEQSEATGSYMQAMSDADRMVNKANARLDFQFAVRELDKATARKKIEGSAIIRSMLQKKLEQLSQ
jgi:hypothetical protein